MICPPAVVVSSAVGRPASQITRSSRKTIYPVAGFAMQVHYRNNVDAIRLVEINDPVGKTIQPVAPCFHGENSLESLTETSAHLARMFGCWYTGWIVA